MNECRKCLEKLPLTAFSLKSNSKKILATCCDKCRATPALTWGKNNPEKMRKAVLRFQATGGSRNGMLVSKYKITIEQYEDLLKMQSGCCAICKADSPGGRWSAFHVDHDHANGRVRGLLCTNCNRGIGYLGDSSSRLVIAAAYLSR